MPLGNAGRFTAAQPMQAVDHSSAHPGLVSWSSERFTGAYSSSATPQSVSSIRQQRLSTNYRFAPTNLVASIRNATVRNTTVTAKNGCMDGVCGSCDFCLSLVLTCTAAIFFIQILASKSDCSPFYLEDNDWSCDSDLKTKRGWMWVLYALNILLGTCWSHTAENLRHSVDGNQLQSYIDKVKKAKMNVSADVQCYHFERKTTGSGKNRKTRTVKKVTHRATENFVYEGCLDKSPSRLAGDGYLFVRVESRVLHEFGDSNTGRAYEEMCSALIRDNRHRDKHISLHKGFDLPGVVEYQLLKMQAKTPGEERMLALLNYRMFICLLFVPFASVAYYLWFGMTAGGAIIPFKKSLTLARETDNSAVAEAEVVVTAYPMAHAIADSNQYWNDVDTDFQEGFGTGGHVHAVLVDNATSNV